MKNLRFVLAALVLLVAAPIRAQRGCFHSPEAPTDVLLLVGSLGLFAGSSIVARLRRRR